jgi:hypothetical protein
LASINFIAEERLNLFTLALMKKYILILLCCTFVACKSSEKVENSTNKDVATMNSEQNTAVSSQIPDTFRVAVIFISIGAGTDQNALPILDKVLADWKLKIGKDLTFNKVGWGREGEVDYCFTLKELNSDMQAQFINNLRDAYKGNELIQIQENHPYRFKGR